MTKCSHLGYMYIYYSITEKKPVSNVQMMPLITPEHTISCYGVRHDVA